MHHGQPIDTAELKFRDAAQWVACGRFRPLPAYDAVRPVFPVFLRFTAAQRDSGQSPDEQAIADYFAARDALELSLQNAEGAPVKTGHIHIVDWGPSNEDELEVEIQMIDDGFWSPASA